MRVITYQVQSEKPSFAGPVFLSTRFSTVFVYYIAGTILLTITKPRPAKLGFSDCTIHTLPISTFYSLAFNFLGYGNIAPKTAWGRIVTIFYALVGIPLFLLWANQMGQFCANVFKFFYYNICCGLCRRGESY